MTMSSKVFPRAWKQTSSPVSLSLLETSSLFGAKRKDETDDLNSPNEQMMTLCPSLTRMLLAAWVCLVRRNDSRCPVYLQALLTLITQLGRIVRLLRRWVLFLDMSMLSHHDYPLSSPYSETPWDESTVSTHSVSEIKNEWPSPSFTSWFHFLNGLKRMTRWRKMITTSPLDGKTDSGSWKIRMNSATVEPVPNRWKQQGDDARNDSIILKMMSLTMTGSSQK